MTTKTEFIETLRRQLDDPDETGWTDEELGSYLDLSVGVYSRHFPNTRYVEFNPDGASSMFDVPDDLLDDRIQRVWQMGPGGVAISIEGGTTPLRPPERAFQVVGQKLSLNYIPQATYTIRLLYDATYSLPETGEAEIPKEDEDLIYLWAEHLAWRKVGAADASLSRWKPEGKRDDSPIIPHYVMLQRQYDRMIDEKKSGGRFLRLRRPRRYGYQYARDSWPLI